MEIPEGKLVTASGLGRDSVLSETISFLRFPLIVLVVTAHVHLDFFVSAEELSNFPLATFFYDLTGHGLVRIAIPLFFFISGYLFFLNTSSFSREFYFGKLKRRFWSLFVPLAVWGTAFFLVQFLAWKLNPALVADPKSFEYSSVPEFVRDLFFRGILAEELTPFWFIRGLIIACILSPLWFFLLKKLKFFPLILFGVWYCFFSVRHGDPPLYGFGAVVVFFFCSGAYFSIHGIDFTKVFRKIRTPFFIAYPILLVGNAVLNLLGYPELYDKMKNFEAIIGLVAAIALVSGFLGKHPNISFPKTLLSATFFVYAGHFFLIRLPRAIFRLYSCECETSLSIILVFLVVTVFAVGGCVLLSILVRKFAPWSIRFLTGGR